MTQLLVVSLVGAFSFGLIKDNLSGIDANFVACARLFLSLLIFLNYLKRHFYKLNLATSLMAIIGTGIVVQSAGLRNNLLAGFLIVQGSNLCFAFGQVYYKTILASSSGIKDQNIFGWLYIGGFLITAITTTLFGGWENLKISSPQWLTSFTWV